MIQIEWEKIRGVIFDVDGTLLDSMGVWENLGERYLATLEIEAEPGLQKKLETMSTKQGSEYLRVTYELPQSPAQTAEGVSRLIEQFYREEAPLKFGMKEYLEVLQTKQIPMMIVTSGEKKHVEAAFGRLGLLPYFQGILTCSQYNTDKTKPDIYIEAAGQMHTNPEQTLVFEDVLHALETAKKAGFLTVAVYDRYSQEQQEDMKRIADYYI